MTFQECLELYPTFAGMAAVVLLIIHLIKPYGPWEKAPRENPPPKFFASFSLGQLIEYIIKVLTFPIVLFAGFAVITYSGSYNAGGVVTFLLLIPWWLLPRRLARKIDGW